MDGDAEIVQHKMVTSRYFSELGVQAALGRVFSDAEEDENVAVISDRLWKRSYRMSPSVVGKQRRFERQRISGQRRH
jgi:hypothetical protein